MYLKRVRDGLFLSSHEHHEQVETHRAIIESDTGRFFDFIKAVSIIGIFCYHFYDRFLGRFDSRTAVESGFLFNLFAGIRTTDQFVCYIFQVVFAFGYLGVELFIIASGFGLYCSYLSHKDPWPVFYRKRAARVLPLYYFFLFLVFILTAFVGRQAFYASPEGIKVLAYHLLLIQTFSNSYLYYGFFYFIAIIFQLYLLFPCLVRVVKNGWAETVIFIVLLASSSVVNGVLAFFGIHFQGILITDFLPFFFLGMMLAQSVHNNGKMHLILLDRRVSFLWGVLLVFVVSFCIGNAYFTKEMRRLVALLVFLSLPFVFGFVKRLYARKIIVLVAYASYPFYLLHMIVINRMNLLAAHFGFFYSYQSWITVGIASFLAALALAYGTQKGYDRIVLRIRKRRISVTPA